MKKVLRNMLVYTAITNNYDTLKDLPKGVGGVCFTDNPSLTSRTWEIKYIKGLDHKAPKMLNHQFFPGQSTMWIDGNVVVNKLPKPAHLATFKAKDYQCAYIEAERCKNGKDTVDRIDSQVAYMKDDNYPEYNGLSACTVIVRDGKQRRLEELWWEQLQRTRRDQISFNYCLWKLGLDQEFIPGSIYQNDYVKWLGVHK